MYILKYKTSFVDPIRSLKVTYINAQLIAIIILTLLTVIISILPKKKKIIGIILRVIIITAIIALIIFATIKINFNRIYNEEKFAEFYELTGQKVENSKVKLSTAKEISLKQAYVEESLKAYRIFTIKVISCMIIYIAIIILNIFIFKKAIKIQGKAEIQRKNEEILFDEEQNVKF